MDEATTGSGGAAVSDTENPMSNEPFVPARFRDAGGSHDERVEFIAVTEVIAAVGYAPDGDQQGKPWVCEISRSGSEADIQGWGCDPLAAALAAAERAYAELILLEDDLGPAAEAPTSERSR